ncbi:DUF167 domain-containing protein [Halorhodospira halophila]|uniref:UPF0235 protein Hhal_0948 n=1 Tax=Halorhodospira halophila (strain DSM 244 / SL1) TaxID=349124 RepID=A1WVL2_HALHL|nr:DUF167 domain-containing protein [Halorhodospira halophila]ABM61724.1 protein of unknown function DUF167 [Halorhodospira halophila SL1]MBK1728946.1 YggU family protein [Halorhodospira halophila]
MPWITPDPEQDAWLVHVRVTPRAKRESLDVEGERLRVRLNTPPVDGKANTALRKLLARQFGVAKSAVSLLRGERSRDKTVRITAPKQWPAGLPHPGEPPAP